ncbi:hypothetical protein [Micromonospora sp. RTGN7]|uniref:hypothetical protein n=1 Tax=Micromonospora sp. RTGN7 TaxID=3016526 RepID=UPI0029FEE71A|nr:hypothetical protein [Micromonospora sp. RTGN7]
MQRGDDIGPDSGAAHTVMLGWHGLLIVGFFVILGRQSGLRGPSYGNSPQEDMLILGVGIAPVGIGTLLAGLVLLRWLLAWGRIGSMFLLGTAAASPTFLLVAVAAGMHLR